MKLKLIRGIVGSGKSTYARELVAEHGYLHFEADMFFMQNGEYKFNPAKLSDAHKWCQNQTDMALSEGRDTVVSNTFVKLWELDAYLKLAEKHGAEVEEIVMTGNYGSIHNVPQETVDRMRNNFELRA